MVTPTVYVLCDQNCKYEGMTKEQILTAITQAVNEGTISNIDTGFVQTVKTINGHALKLFVGTQAEYDELTAAQKENLFAIITNDTTKEGFSNAIETLRADLTSLETRFNTCAVKRNILATFPATQANQIMGDYKSFLTGYNLGEKNIVVQVEIQNADVYGGTFACKFLTTAFRSKKCVIGEYTYLRPYTFTVSDITFSFYTDGILLYAKVDIGGTGIADDKYYITAIYEEM